MSGMKSMRCCGRFLSGLTFGGFLAATVQPTDIPTKSGPGDPPLTAMVVLTDTGAYLHHDTMRDEEVGGRRVIVEYNITELRDT
jgi:hypothetical protein